jgi:hypothetical protein
MQDQINQYEKNKEENGFCIDSVKKQLKEGIEIKEEKSNAETEEN